MIDIKTAFSEVYKKKTWGKGSGYGSNQFAAVKYIAMTKKLMRDLGISSIVEIGCGDFQIMKNVVDGSIQYTGYDVVSDLIQSNNTLHGSKNIEFIDFTDYQELKNGDLLIIKDVLQHLPINENLRMLSSIHKYKYVLVTNCIGHRKSTIVNREVKPGEFTNIDLTANPYSLEVIEVLRWRAPIRSILLPDLSIKSFFACPLVFLAMLERIILSHLRQNFDDYPIWVKSSVLISK
jgi:hypothetical protein